MTKNRGKIESQLQVMRVSGAAVEVSLETFGKLLSKVKDPMVVVSKRGWRGQRYRYLTSYKGFILCTRSKETMIFPDNVELLNAEKVKLSI